MKKLKFYPVIFLSFFSAFMILSNFSFSQAVISVDKMNVLYSGVDNPVTIAVAGIESSKLNLKAENANITKVDDMHYLVNPSNNSKSVSLTVFSLNGSDTINHGQFFFRIIPIPVPNLIVGNTKIIQEDSITDIQYVLLKSQPYLFCSNENFEFNIKYKITSFYISYNIDDYTFEKQVNGNQIPEDILIEMGKLTKPTVFVISDIIVNQLNFNSRSFNLGSFKFNLK